MCGTQNTNANELDGFTTQQQNYLNELIATLDLQAAFVTPPEQTPQPVTVHGTPYEDLCKEERAKHETHPWEVWTALNEHAQRDQMPQGIDTFMFKHHGLFNVAPAQPGFMCRLRMPGGIIQAHQLAGLADLAQKRAGGYAHVTTRGNLQLREIAPAHIIDLLNSLADLGLTSRGSGADSVRNITCSPSAGFDPHELIDLSPYAKQLHHLILNSRELHGIPRKFNIAFDCGGSLSCVSDTNDIAYLAVKLDDQDAQIDPGVYCRVLLGGITGHQDFARDTGVVVRPQDTVQVSAAMLRVFIEHGDRTNRNKARLKYVLDKHGLDWFINQTQTKLDETGHDDIKLLRVPAAHDAPRQPINRQGHIGVHVQSDPALRWVGVAIPVGKLKPHQMQGLADLANTFGQRELRLTVWQNLIIPHIPQSQVQTVLDGLDALGLSARASSFAAGAVACTGKFACKYASTHTKSHAAQLVEHLQNRFELDTPINMHLTGCPHSCAQHYIGDIGLLGAMAEDGREAYHVFLGGGSDHDQGLARRLTGPVPGDELPLLLEHIVSVYLEHRRDGETFVAFTQRQADDRLTELFLAPVAVEMN